MTRRDSRLTKMDMARVVVQALFNTKEPAAEDHPMVRYKIRLPGKVLHEQYELALKAIRST